MRGNTVPIKWTKIIYHHKFKTGAVILSKSTDFHHFGPEMKVQRSIEAPGNSEINIKVMKDMQFTNEVD